jgi:hypothetical protein
MAFDMQSDVVQQQKAAEADTHVFHTEQCHQVVVLIFSIVYPIPEPSQNLSPLAGDFAALLGDAIWPLAGPCATIAL